MKHRLCFKTTIIITAITLFILTGCSSKEIAKIEDAVDSFLTLYHNCDAKVGMYLPQFRNREITYDGVQRVMAQKIEHTVKSVKKDADYFVVVVQIKNVDFRTVFENLQSEYPYATSEEITLKLEETIDSENAPKRIFNVEIPVTIRDDEVSITLTPELSNALLGGYNEYISELVEEMLNEKDN